MRFGKTVFAETLDLLEDALEVFVGIAVRAHAALDLVVERLKAAAPLPRRHRAAQLIGLAGGEIGDDLDQLHHLFLEDRHAERAFQYFLDA